MLFRKLRHKDLREVRGMCCDRFQRMWHEVNCVAARHQSGGSSMPSTAAQPPVATEYRQHYASSSNRKSSWMRERIDFAYACGQACAQLLHGKRAKFSFRKRESTESHRYVLIRDKYGNGQRDGFSTYSGFRRGDIFPSRHLVTMADAKRGRLFYQGLKISASSIFE